MFNASKIDFLISDRDDTLIPAEFHNAGYEDEDVRLIDHPFTLSLFQMMNQTSRHAVKVLSKGQGAQSEDDLRINFDKPLTYGLHGSHDPQDPLNVEYFPSGIINLGNSKLPAGMNIVAEGLYAILGSSKIKNEPQIVLQILSSELPKAFGELERAQASLLQTKRQVNTTLAFTNPGGSLLSMSDEDIQAAFDQSKQEIEAFAKSFFDFNDEEVVTNIKDVELPLCIKVNEEKNQYIKINFSLQAILDNPQYHASTGKNFGILSRLAKNGYAINPDNLNPDLGVIGVEYINFAQQGDELETIDQRVKYVNFAEQGNDLKIIDQRNVVFLDDEPDSVYAAQIFGFTGIIAASNEIIKTKSSEDRKDGVRENVNNHRKQLFEKMDDDQKRIFLEHYFENDQFEAAIFVRGLDSELGLTGVQQEAMLAFSNLDRLVSDTSVAARNHEDYTSFANYLKEIANNVIIRDDFKKAIPKKGRVMFKEPNPTPEQSAWMKLAELDTQGPDVNKTIIAISKDVDIDTMKNLVVEDDLAKYNVISITIVHEN